MTTETKAKTILEQTEAFERYPRLADDKAKADIIQNTPAGHLSIKGPLFGTQTQHKLF